MGTATCWPGSRAATGLVERVRLVELAAEESALVLRAWPVRIRRGARIMRDAGVVADLEPDSFAA